MTGTVKTPTPQCGMFRAIKAFRGAVGSTGRSRGVKTTLAGILTMPMGVKEIAD